MCVKESVNAENTRQSFKTNCRMYLNGNISLTHALPTNSLKFLKMQQFNEIYDLCSFHIRNRCA